MKIRNKRKIKLKVNFVVYFYIEFYYICIEEELDSLIVSKSDSELNTPFLKKLSDITFAYKNDFHI